MIKDCE